MGLLFTLEDPTPLAWQEISEAGHYTSPVDGHEYPKVVVHTVRELLVEGRLPDLPTRHGIQQPLWPLPASTRSVRLRPVRPAPASPGRRGSPESEAAAAIRERDRQERAGDHSGSTRPARIQERSRGA